MIDHVWSVICVRCVTDPSTNNVSLIDVTEHVKIETKKGKEGGVKPNSAGTLVVPFRAQLVTLWIRGDLGQAERGKARMLISSPSGKELGKNEYIIDLTEFRRVRSVTNLNGLPVEIGREGYYRFRVDVFDEKSSEWREVANVPLDIELAI